MKPHTIAPSAGRSGRPSRVSRPGVGRVDETPALVAVITRKRDWRLVEREHWYRIPVSKAPEGLRRAKYLAWYQTSVFGDEKWSVNYYAGVEGIVTRKRVELLPDEPNHCRARESYYQVRVGEVRRLPTPIPSRRLRRIVFIPTSLERLLAAKEINDLYMTSPIEDRLYSALAGAGLDPERQFLVREAGTGYMLDLAVFCKDGGLNIECDGEAYHSGKEAAEQDRSRDNALTSSGWRILRFSGREINQNPDRCVDTIRRTVRRLGGKSRG